MTRQLQSLFADYAAHHRTAGNQACHAIGIPLIVLGILVMLSHVPLFVLGARSVTLAEPTLLAATLYYLTQDARLAGLMLIASGALLAGGRLLPFAAGATLFALGWILQFVGHYVYEKRSPAFFRSLAHLLVGPLWLLAKATRRA